MWYNILNNKKLKDLSLYELRDLIVRSEDLNIKDPRILRNLVREYTLTFWAGWLKNKFNDSRSVSEIKEIIEDETKLQKFHH